MKPLGFAVSFLNVASAISPYIRPYEVSPLLPNATKVQHRIYGGMEAKEGQFPFMIFVLMNLTGQKYAKCSSSLISSEWVLLAGHCLFPSLQPEDILVIGGKADLWDYVHSKIFSTSFSAPMDEDYLGVQLRRAKEFFVHPLYCPETLEHDVGLIRVSSPFRLGHVQTIPVSTEKIKALKMCTILGWGLTTGNIDTYKLNYIENKKVSTTKIGCNYKETGSFICLEKDGTGICQGDSGGPLVCDGKVWGVASHYVTASEEALCGDSLEEYYSDLSENIHWIKEVYDKPSVGSVVGTSLKTALLCFVFLWLSAKR